MEKANKKTTNEKKKLLENKLIFNIKLFYNCLLFLPGSKHLHLLQQSLDLLCNLFFIFVIKYLKN